MKDAVGRVDRSREFALRCISLDGEGKGSVLKTLAEHYGQSERTIANRIAKARKDGYLYSLAGKDTLEASYVTARAAFDRVQSETESIPKIEIDDDYPPGTVF